MRNSIRTRLAIAFIALTASLLLFVGLVLAWQSYVAEQRQVLEMQRERTQSISTEITSYMRLRENALTQLISIRGLGDLDKGQQTQLLSELVSYSHAFNKLSLVGGNGREKISISNTEVISQLRDLSGTDEFKTPVSNNQVYYGPVQFSENTGEPYLVISVPVTNVRSGKVTNVLVAEVRLKPVWDLLAGLSLGQGSSAYIVDSQNRVVAHNNPSVVLRNTIFKIPPEDGIHSGVNGTSVDLVSNRIKFGQQEFTVVTEIPSTEALAEVYQTELTLAELLLVAILIAGGLGWFAARQIVQPIETLVKTAQAVSAGDLSQQVEMSRRDEIGTLANAFNQMTSQLRDLIGSLEARVAARTQDLATVAEVGTATATILETDKLLHEVVELTKERFHLYHSHIYLLDEKGENLVLAAGAGEPGRIMVAEKRSIPLDREQSLVARAARERKGVTVNDVTQAPDFLPNPLLPNTRSELAVPMIVGSNLIGVFDIQSDRVGRFTDSDINIQTTLAAQVATSIQNVRSFEQSKVQADLVSLVNTIGQKIQRTTTVEDTLQTAIREIGLALGAARVSAHVQAARVDNITGEN